jgi:hypothetical protein
MKKLTLEEVLIEAHKLNKTGSLEDILAEKEFLHQHENNFTGWEAEKLGNAISSLFQDIEHAIIIEHGSLPDRRNEDEADDTNGEDDVIVITIPAGRGQNDPVRRLNF